MADGRQKQRHRADGNRRGFREQIQIVSDRRAQRIDLIRLGRQFDRLVEFAVVLLGEERHRAVAGVEIVTEQFIVEGAAVGELDACGARVFDGLLDAHAGLQLLFGQARAFEPVGGLIVVHRHRQVQRLNGFFRGVLVEARGSADPALCA